MVGERGIDARELHHRTAGNPYFVTEVLANEGIAMPPTVRDAVLARVARLSPPAQQCSKPPRLSARGSTCDAGGMGFGDPAPIDECLADGMLAEQADLLTFRTNSHGRRYWKRCRRAARSFASHGRSRSSATLRRQSRRGASGVSRRRSQRLRSHPRVRPAGGTASASSTSHRAAGALYRLALRCADRSSPCRARRPPRSVLSSVQYDRPAG